MAVRSLKASELRGRHIYQLKNKTVYSDFFMKNHGYLITDEEADHYHSYTLRLFESIFGFAILLFVTKSNVLISFLIALAAYVVISLLFYFKFLKSLPKIENFKKEARDGYIVSTAKEMSSGRILAISILLVVFTAAIIYYPYSNGLEGIFKVLLIGIGIASGIFALMNFASLFYKIIKRV